MSFDEEDLQLAIVGRRTLPERARKDDLVLKLDGRVRLVGAVSS